MLINNQREKFGISKLFLLCLAGFTLGRLFIFPGFLDPLVPSHSDLYRYVAIGQRIWTSEVWLSPRPLMLLFLHLLGVFQLPAAMWLLLSLTSIAFAAALVFVLQHFGGLQPNVISVLLYSLIIFSLPTSFEIYQLDFGGMLAGVLSLAAIYFWLHYYQTDTKKAFLSSLLIFWASLEMKPTFAASILFLAFLQLVFRRDKTSLLLLVAVFGIVVFVLLKDRLLGSPFLGSGRGAGVYAIQIAPSKNLHALWLYSKDAVTKELLPGLAIAYYLFGRVFKQSWIKILGLLLLAVSTMLPMIIIPNRVLVLYAWYFGMVLCIPFLYILQLENTEPTDVAPRSSLIYKALVSIGLLVTIAALSLTSELNSAEMNWYLDVSKYNRNVIASLPHVRDLNTNYNFNSSKGILISGIRGPFHPYSSRTYIQFVTHLPDNYALLLRKSEVSWNDSLSDLGIALYTDQLDINEFDYFILYDQGGNISRMLFLEDVKAIPVWRQIPTLACNLNANPEYWTTSHVESVVACLDKAGEGQATLEFLDHIDTAEITPWLHYYWGHAYELTGNLSSAREEYKIALAADKNDFFRRALEALRGK